LPCFYHSLIEKKMKIWMVEHILFGAPVKCNRKHQYLGGFENGEHPCCLLSPDLSQTKVMREIGPLLTSCRPTSGPDLAATSIVIAHTVVVIVACDIRP